MSLRNALTEVLGRYAEAQSAAFKAHPLADFIRSDLKQEIEKIIHPLQPGLSIECSPGKGNWADVPWASVFEDSETDTAQRGVYIVYLFNIAAGTVALSLNQGTTFVRREFGKAAPDILRDRARVARMRLKEWTPKFPEQSISLGSTRELPLDYEAGHILGTVYGVTTLPSDQKIEADLLALVEAYRALLFRGPPEEANGGDEAPGDVVKDVVERRQYARHLRIERNPKAAAAAKKFHGTKCQACGMEFGIRYGELGAGFCEAHHMRPISSIKEGEAVTYNIASDFAVLCSNCHRMIHRMPDPSDIKGLRRILRDQRKIMIEAKAKKGGK